MSHSSPATPKKSSNKSKSKQGHPQQKTIGGDFLTVEPGDTTPFARNPDGAGPFAAYFPNNGHGAPMMRLPSPTPEHLLKAPPSHRRVPSSSESQSSSKASYSSSLNPSQSPYTTPRSALGSPYLQMPSSRSQSPYPPQTSRSRSVSPMPHMYYYYQSK